MSAPTSSPANDPDRYRSFVDAGVRFELGGSSVDPFAPEAVVPQGASFATAHVAVAREGAMHGTRRIDLRVDVDPDRFVSETAGARIEGRLARDAFEGRATLALAHPFARTALVLPIASALAEARGGGAFHAAVARVDDRAIVFVGPSGSGKSTACRLLPGATELAADRVLLVPDGDALVAYRLDGGEPTGLPLAPDGVVVAAILRVRFDGVRHGIVREPAARILGELRAATLLAHGSDEERALDRCLGIARRTVVGTVHTRLDRPIDLGALR